MDTIAFLDTGVLGTGVRIIVNGRELIEIVQEVELGFATREGHPDLAGAYSYFGPMCVFLPARHFLGEPMHDWSDGPGRIYLLSCTCGIPDCWPLSVRVELREHEVVWSDFRQRHRGPQSETGEWCYDGLGPFVFDRHNYEQELGKTPVIPKQISHKKTIKSRLTEVFNLGFRHGANDRAAAGIIISSERPPSTNIPSPPSEFGDDIERKAWMEGYRGGYKCGASDAELASVEIPGAHGMISGFDWEFLERFGFFKEFSDHDAPS